MPNPHEVARLFVRSSNMEYVDWETVYVQHRWQEGWPTFRFTATEGGELPWDWAKLQFKPMDPVAIELGGQLAITGLITQRQVAYAGTEHGVQLSGVGRQWLASTSSVPSENNQNNFDNMPVTAIAQKVVASVGGSLRIVGVPHPMPFEVMQSQPGELVFDFLDKIARMRNARLGSDHLGNLILVGDHTAPIMQQLIEGQNILKMQVIFSCELLYGEYKLTGQFKVKNNLPMQATNEIIARAFGALPGLNRALEIVTEHPAMNPAELEMRATYEKLERDGTQVTANVTVQGWLRDGKNLWACGDAVRVYSPMAPLNLVMGIKTATFTQDNKSGTTTVLECVLPTMMGMQSYKLDQSGNQPGVVTPPDEAPPKTTSSA